MEVSDKVLQTTAQYSFDKFLKAMEEAAVSDELDEILVEIKELYKSDGLFDSLEQSIFSMLNKLLKVN